jgi:hypothetical protein
MGVKMSGIIWLVVHETPVNIVRTVIIIKWLFRYFFSSKICLQKRVITHERSSDWVNIPVQIDKPFKLNMRRKRPYVIGRSIGVSSSNPEAK